jgi:hypothetical protein
VSGRWMGLEERLLDGGEVGRGAAHNEEERVRQSRFCLAR